MFTVCIAWCPINKNKQTTQDEDYVATLNEAQCNAAAPVNLNLMGDDTK